MFGQNGENPPDPNRYYKLETADLVVPNMDAWHLMWDYEALHQLTHELPNDSVLHNRAKITCNEIINVFRVGDLKSIADCRKTAETVLGKDWVKEIAKESEKASEQQGRLWGVGHW